MFYIKTYTKNNRYYIDMESRDLYKDWFSNSNLNCSFDLEENAWYVNVNDKSIAITYLYDNFGYNEDGSVKSSDLTIFMDYFNTEGISSVKLFGVEYITFLSNSGEVRMHKDASVILGGFNVSCNPDYTYNFNVQSGTKILIKNIPSNYSKFFLKTLDHEGCAYSSINHLGRSIFADIMSIGDTNLVLKTSNFSKLSTSIVNYNHNEDIEKFTTNDVEFTKNDSKFTTLAVESIDVSQKYTEIATCKEVVNCNDTVLDGKFTNEDEPCNSVYLKDKSEVSLVDYVASVDNDCNKEISLSVEDANLLATNSLKDECDISPNICLRKSKTPTCEEANDIRDNGDIYFKKTISEKTNNVDYLECNSGVKSKLNKIKEKKIRKKQRAPLGLRPSCEMEKRFREIAKNEKLELSSFFEKIIDFYSEHYSEESNFSKIEKLKNEISKKDELYNSLLKETEELKKDLCYFSSENSKLKTNIQSLEVNVEELKLKNMMLDTNNLSLQSKLDVFIPTVENLKNTIKELSSMQISNNDKS